MKIYSLQQLQAITNFSFLIQRVESGFAAYSKGDAAVPQVVHMEFMQPPGNLHIKCASSKEDYYAVKIASCFPKNSEEGLNTLQGMILLFCKRTGKPEVLFQDEGYLTNLRTGIAGAICAKYLAPKNLGAIGIIGTGAQARFQLRLLRAVVDCRKVWIWSPNRNSMIQFQQEPEFADFTIMLASTPAEAAKHCRLIATTTPSREPLLRAADIQPGTHITALGSDSPGKQELDPVIFKKAKRIIVDSRLQCFAYGETFCALKACMIAKSQVEELGELVAGYKSARETEDEITLADLTGLGIQDLEIALGFKQLLEIS